MAFNSKRGKHSANGWKPNISKISNIMFFCPAKIVRLPLWTFIQSRKWILSRDSIHSFFVQQALNLLKKIARNSIMTSMKVRSSQMKMFQLNMIIMFTNAHFAIQHPLYQFEKYLRAAINADWKHFNGY